MRTMGVFLVIVFLGVGVVFGAQNFVRVDGVDDNLYSVEVNPIDNNIWVVGSDNAIFLSKDGGKNFEKVFVIKSDNSKVNAILFDKEDKNRIYFATGAGLYITEDLGNSFERIFSEYKEEEGYVAVLSVCKKDNIIYAGTEQGLYKADKSFYNFRRVTAIPQEAEVNDIIMGFDGRLILATSQGVFIETGPQREEYKRTFISRDYEEEVANGPLSLFQDNIDRKRIYLGTTQGLFVSDDNGNNFKKVGVPGLSGLRIEDIEINPVEYSELLLATDNGLYTFNIRTKETGALERRNFYHKVRDIHISSEGVVLLATDKGIYVKGIDVVSNPKINKAAQCFKCEPTYMQVQEVALRYNEVHPEQIERWRRSLKYRALFPTLQLDYDKTIYGTAGGATYDGKSYVGPRDWGASLSWDIGDLVWNSYEDDIDTKSRLKTQTRIDILDDLRRIYFERKKAKLDLISNKDLPEAEYLKKELYLEELTAALDSYTGGYFSHKCREMRSSTKK